MIYIYGRMSCPFCVKAVELCKEQGVEFKFNPLMDGMRMIAAQKGHYTVPVVFDGKEFIGGYDELRKKLTVHNTWEKIQWWLVTAFHFFHCQNTYRTRINARNACAAKATVQYLSGKGKDVS